ncbi:MAG TPA: hypothetical protein VKE92_09170 [Anaerolineales bacterium]|nr:hypothetical protein [Anaerolineales bacterium]
MNQPDLGLKITELRQQKGLTRNSWRNTVTSAPGPSSASKAVRWSRVRSHVTA